jgi:dissimilatory sulfite reductase (desulfoviridin) alpha/beta subunit
MPLGLMTVNNKPLQTGKRNLIGRKIIHTPIHCVGNIVCKLTIINMAKVRNTEVISEKFNTESVPNKFSLKYTKITTIKATDL